MLRKYGDIAAGGPMLAEKDAASASAAQAVAEQDHRSGRGVRRKVNPQGNVALTGGIVNRQVHMRRMKRRVHRQRIVIVGADFAADAIVKNTNPPRNMKQRRDLFSFAFRLYVTSRKLQQLCRCSE